MHRRLMPFLLLMYVLAFLDRTNIGFAQQALESRFGIGPPAYAFGASLFFVGYALLEVPANLLLVRFGARLWMARIMTSWGLVAAAMMFVGGARDFYLLRALLGIAEAGFFPGILLPHRFYPAADRGRAMGLFYFGAPISFVIGGPLSGALLELDGLGGLAGWQWLFAVEGLAASVVGVAALFVLSDRPSDARWLSAGERNAVAGALAQERAAADRQEIEAASRLLRTPIVWGLAGIYALVQMVVYGLIFFLPQQVSALIGEKVGLKVGFVSAVPWLAAIAACWWVPGIARRTATVPVAAVTLALAGAGVALSVALSGAHPPLAFAGLCVAAGGIIAVRPLFWSIATARLSEAQSAAGIAFVNALGAAASFVAPNLRVAVEGASGVQGSGLYALSMLALAGAAGLLGLRTSLPSEATR
jgi:MFS family permease